MAQTLDIFKALADEARLRILRAICTAELSVAELVHILGMPQSTVSRHLKPLRDSSLVATRREGTSIYYNKGKALEDPLFAEVLDARLEDVQGLNEDKASIRRVLDGRRQRSKDFFDNIAGSYGTLTQPGGGWEAMAAAVAVGFTGKTVADLGAGEGALTLLLAQFAKEVIALDQSSEMLRQVTARARQEGIQDRVLTVEGDLESIPLETKSVDAVFLSQALHHAARPSNAVSEAARILRPGGILIVLDLDKHEQDWVREQWADQWLGFVSDEIELWFSENGIETMTIKRLEGTTPELAVLLMTGIKSMEE